jgi:hypothetical protein
MIKLRDYQEEISTKAANLLRSKGIVYLAMEVRTGKTITAMATAYKANAENILFVTKKKAINDIIAQIRDDTRPEIVDVINYEQLHNVKRRYDLVIIDEAHSLGAFPVPSVRVKELKRICQRVPIIYLSGTPTPESYSQIFHQLFVSSFSPFSEYKNFYQWAKDFVHLKKKYVFNKAINDYSDANSKLINEYTGHLFFTYTQQEAGFMQLVQENILYVKMEESTYKFANRLRIDKIVTNKEFKSVLGDTAVKLMNKLHQIYSGTVLIDEPEREGKVFDYTKAEFIKHYFKDKKIAIFYKFVSEAYAIRWVFGKVYDDPQEFNEAESGVFISQIVSGREGINLSTADALVFYNIDFSATSYWQSRARIQTKDREKDAQIYWIFAEAGIEDKIYKAVMDKKDYTLSHFKKDFSL